MAGYDNDELSVDDLLAAFGGSSPSAGNASKPKARTKKPSAKASASGQDQLLSDGEIDLLAALGLASPEPKRQAAPQAADRETVREASRREQQIRSQQWQQELQRREERIARAQAAQAESAAQPNAGPIVEEGGFRRSSLPQGLSDGSFEQIEPFNIPEPAFLQGGIQNKSQQPSASAAPVQPSALDAVKPGVPDSIQQSPQQQSPQPAAVRQPQIQQMSPQTGVAFGSVAGHPETADVSRMPSQAALQASDQGSIAAAPTGLQAQPAETAQEPEQFPPPEQSQMLQPFNPNIAPGSDPFFNRKVVVSSDQTPAMQDNPAGAPIASEAVSADIERRTFSFAPVSTEPVIHRLGDQTSQSLQPLQEGVAASGVASAVEGVSAAETSQFESVVSESAPDAVQLEGSAADIQAVAVSDLETAQPDTLPSGFVSAEPAPAMPMQPSAPVADYPMNAAPAVQGAPGMPAPAPFGTSQFAPQADMPSMPMQPAPMGTAGPMVPPSMPYDQAPSPFLGASPMDTGVSSQLEIESDASGSKRNSILGIVLIVVALLCAVMAIGLLSGMFNMLQPAASQPSQATSGAVQSQSSAEDVASDDVVEPTTEAVYSYVVRGVDGTTHEATETAVFDENNILKQSTIEIDVENADVANALLAQLTDEFGTSVTASEADDNHVQITLNINRDDLTKEAYTELLSANMTEFKQIS